MYVSDASMRWSAVISTPSTLAMSECSATGCSPRYATERDGHWPAQLETWYWAAARPLCLLLQLRLCAPCQNFWLVFCDQNSVLEVRRGHAIRRAHRPPIVEQSYVGRADVNHRLNG